MVMINILKVSFLKYLNIIKRFCERWVLFFFNRCQSTLADWKVAFKMHTKSLKKFLVKYWELTTKNFWLQSETFIRSKLSHYKDLFMENAQNGFEVVCLRVTQDWQRLCVFLAELLQENKIILAYRALKENTDYVAGFVVRLFQKDIYVAVINALWDAEGRSILTFKPYFSFNAALNLRNSIAYRDLVELIRALPIEWLANHVGPVFFVAFFAVSAPYEYFIFQFDPITYMKALIEAQEHYISGTMNIAASGAPYVSVSPEVCYSLTEAHNFLQKAGEIKLANLHDLSLNGSDLAGDNGTLSTDMQKGTSPFAKYQFIVNRTIIYVGIGAFVAVQIFLAG